MKPYSIQVIVLDPEGNSLLEMRLTKVAKEDLFAPGATTPGEDLVIAAIERAVRD